MCELLDNPLLWSRVDNTSFPQELCMKCKTDNQELSVSVWVSVGVQFHEHGV